ncbi:MAG: RHS repeat-associated core domain-containing protein [Candidatus Thiodiazotropha endolucinida]
MTETLDSTTTTYSYNARNELVSVVQGGNTTEYGYNPNGIRSSKRENGVTTRYIVDENRDYAQVLIEDDGTVQVSYTYGDDLISQDRSGEIHYYHYDGLGSTRSLTDSLGNLANTYDYEAFGEVLNQTGTTENSYLFAGEQFDSTLDQYYLRARYYDPSQGRFTQMDSFLGWEEDPTTLHKYLYANADPVNGTDPSGYMTLSGLMTGVGGFFRLSTIALPAYSGVMGKVAIGFVGAGLGYGLSENVKEFIARNAPVMHRLLEGKRAKQRARIEKKSRGRRVLYNYGSRARVLTISAFGVGSSSPGYGRGRPPGFYGTSIAPWSVQYTQEELSALFYGGNRHRDVSWFVAFDGQSFIKYPGNSHEYYRPSLTGEVDLDVITIGRNLMLPR